MKGLKQDACSAIIPGAHHQRVVERRELEVLDDGIADHVIKGERHCGRIIVANARVGVIRPRPAGRSACQRGKRPPVGLPAAQQRREQTR